MADRFLQYSPPPVRDAVVNPKRGGLLTTPWERWFWRLEDMLYKRPSCKVSFTADQSIGNAAYADLLWTAEDHDNATMHSTSTNTDRITIQEDGVYAFGCEVTWKADGAGTGLRGTLITLNDDSPWAASAPLVDVWYGAKVVSTWVVRQCISTTADLDAGDILRVSVYQDSGGALDAVGTTTSGPRSNGFWCFKVSK